MDGAGLLFARVNEDDDPRIGSSRDNSSSATVTGISTGSNSASISALFTTLIPVSVYVAVCIAIFLFFRRKCPRVYAPRTFLASLHPFERTAPLPATWFAWFREFWRIPDEYVLNHSSIDGFLFLRFLRVVRNICLVGCCLTWPILLPLHICGGGDGEQLDRLTFGNVSDGRWHFAHALVAWVFFAFVLYTVCRECIYAINLRQAYLLSPFYADRLSSRTVLFTCVPEQLLDEAKLRKVFGDSAKTVWIPKTSWELERLVRERDQTASRLQGAELELIRKANAAWRRLAKTGHPDIVQPDLEHGPLEQPSPDSTTAGSPDEKAESENGMHQAKFGPEGPPFDVPGSIAAQWIPQEARPTHRPLANFGRKTDTIRWTRKRLKKLGREIAKVRKRINRGDSGSALPAVFIEFTDQNEAQIAYQSLTHHRPSHMSQRYIGVRPYEVLWGSLRMRWWQRIVRRFGILTATILMTVFWSIPCAFVGLTSNINYLADKIPFLAWLGDLPPTILGFVTGLLPALMLSLLMSIVPGILRVLARAAGVPSLSLVELFTQRAYFGFQVLQVFLVTTFTSSASSSINSIIDNPMSARELLSDSLPKASNFYLSYMIIQCLGAGASQIAHISGIFKYCIVPRFVRNPRITYTRWHRMRPVHWGGVMPVFVNLGVIALSYSVIAPLILGFTALGCSIMHLVYKYNLLFVFGSEVDTRGLSYILAIKQLLTGLYLAQICLLGLFALRLTFGPVVMMFISITLTAVVHISLDEAVGPLLDNLPRTLTSEKSPAHDVPAETAASVPDYGDLPWETNTAAPASNVEFLDIPLETPDAVAHMDDGPRATSTPSDPTLDESPANYDYDSDSSDSSQPSTQKLVPSNARALEGAEGVVATTFTLLKLLARAALTPSPPSTTPPPLDPGESAAEPLQPHQPASPAKERPSTARSAARKALATLSLLISPPDPLLTTSASASVSTAATITSSPLASHLLTTLLTYLHPSTFASVPLLRAALFPPSHPSVQPPTNLTNPYAYPPMISGAPRLWIPDDSDGAGCGVQERAHSGRVVGVVGVGGVERAWGELVDDSGGVWLRDGGLDWGRGRWW